MNVQIIELGTICNAKQSQLLCLSGQVSNWCRAQQVNPRILRLPPNCQGSGGVNFGELNRNGQGRSRFRIVVRRPRSIMTWLPVVNLLTLVK